MPFGDLFAGHAEAILAVRDLPYTDLMATPVRSRRIEVRVTEDEHAAEDIAARTLGVSLSEFYRQAARERAAEILAERSRVVLEDNAAQRFLDALDHPERFADRLRWLADRPSVLSDE
jgi:uncharacterized protein (DUF1778 family)